MMLAVRTGRRWTKPQVLATPADSASRRGRRQSWPALLLGVALVGLFAFQSMQTVIH